MLKKLFVTAAAAAAVSVPLAGAAWATPSDNNPPGHPEQGTTGPGVPHEAGATLDAITASGQLTHPDAGLADLNPNGTGNPVPPGTVYSNIAKQPGNTPDAAQAFVGGVYKDYLDSNAAFSTTGLAPGHATKSFTPGCPHGRTGIVNGTSDCN
jgi:hypothetical protein